MNMRTVLFRLFLLPLVLGCWLLASCATVSVSYDYDPDMDFSRLNSYQWLPVSHPENISELNVRRVTDAVDAVLAGKGYSVTADTPDFRLAAHFGKEARVDIAAAGAHDQTREGTKSHRSVDRVPARDGCDACPIAEVAGDDLELVDREAFEIGQRGISGSKIVD